MRLQLVDLRVLGLDIGIDPADQRGSLGTCGGDGLQLACGCGFEASQPGQFSTQVIFSDFQGCEQRLDLGDGCGTLPG